MRVFGELRRQQQGSCDHSKPARACVHARARGLALFALHGRPGDAARDLRRSGLTLHAGAWILARSRRRPRDASRRTHAKNESADV